MTTKVCVVEELVGGAGSVMELRKSKYGIFWTTSQLSTWAMKSE